MSGCIYHYCASFQVEPGVVEYRDGSVETSSPVRSREDYHRIRDEIADTVGHPKEGLIILSLTLLNSSGFL